MSCSNTWSLHPYIWKSPERKKKKKKAYKAPVSIPRPAAERQSRKKSRILKRVNHFMQTCEYLQRQRRQTMQLMQGSGVLSLIFSFVFDLDHCFLYQISKKIASSALVPFFFTDQCYVLPPEHRTRRSLSILHRTVHVGGPPKHFKKVYRQCHDFLWKPNTEITFASQKGSLVHKIMNDDPHLQVGSLTEPEKSLSSLSSFGTICC